jgi:hypothetical protein
MDKLKMNSKFTKILFLSLLMWVYFINPLFAQKPDSAQFINYQISIRDKQGTPIVNKQIALLVDILDNNANIYREWHTNLNTASFGILNIQIGRGNSTIQSNNNFPAPSKYASGNLKLAISIDTNNTSIYSAANFTLISTGDLLHSVPIALYAKKAAGTTNYINGNTASQNNIGVKNDLVLDTATDAAKLYIQKGNNILGGKHYSLLPNSATYENKFLTYKTGTKSWEGTSNLVLRSDSLLGLNLGSSLPSSVLDVKGDIRFRSLANASQNYLLNGAPGKSDKPNSTLEVAGTFATKTEVQNNFGAIGQLIPLELANAHHYIYIGDTVAGHVFRLPDPATVPNREYVLDVLSPNFLFNRTAEMSCAFQDYSGNAIDVRFIRSPFEPFASNIFQYIPNLFFAIKFNSTLKIVSTKLLDTNLSNPNPNTVKPCWLII